MCGRTPRTAEEIQDHAGCIALYPATRPPADVEPATGFPVPDLAVETPSVPPMTGRTDEIALPSRLSLPPPVAEPPFKIPI